MFVFLRGVAQAPLGFRHKDGAPLHIHCQSGFHFLFKGSKRLFILRRVPSCCSQFNGLKATPDPVFIHEPFSKDFQLQLPNHSDDRVGGSNRAEELNCTFLSELFQSLFEIFRFQEVF